MAPQIPGVESKWEHIQNGPYFKQVKQPEEYIGFSHNQRQIRIKCSTTMRENEVHGTMVAELK